MSASCAGRPANFLSVPVAATATKILANNSDRTAITLAATDADIFVGIDANVTALTGMKISANANPFTLCVGHGGSFVQRDLWAITAAGTHNVVIVEAFEPMTPGS